uniref:Secreted protein n=1 Tax=Plectus sambesii TaxID=2011161 RepID=A0A914UIF1_9BILA
MPRAVSAAAAVAAVFAFDRRTGDRGENHTRSTPPERTKLYSLTRNARETEAARAGVTTPADLNNRRSSDQKVGRVLTGERRPAVVLPVDEMKRKCRL